MKLPASAALVLLLALLPQASHGQSAPAWRDLTTEPYPKKRDDIDFIDSQTGFYGTGKGRLYKTSDGGKTWTLAWDHPGTFIRSLGFVDAQHGFLGNLGVGLADTSDATPLYQTDDGGRTWRPAGVDGRAVPGICSIDILHARAIVAGEVQERTIITAAGRANGPAKLVRSEDGGRTWSVIDLSDRAGMILDVKFRDPNVGFVFAGTSSDLAQASALILKTSDGGRTWREVYRSSRLNEIIWKASLPDAKTGYATLQNDDEQNRQQRIVKTTDGGDHWVEAPLVLDAHAQEFGIGFVSAQHGWVGTASGGFETRDGGKTWTPSSLARTANKIRTQSADGAPMIYAIGSKVQIYR